MGDGNAGRAYKNNVVRCYDHTISDPKRQTYVFIPGQSSHQFLCSIPLQNPDSPDLIFAVLNIGAFAQREATLLRGLNNEAGITWLLERAHNEVLPRIRDIAIMTPAASSKGEEV